MENVTKALMFLRDLEGKKIRAAVPIVIGFLILTAIWVGISMVPGPADRLFVSRAGYTLRYPADWIVGEVRRDSSYESELIREPYGHATVAISSHSEPRLRELTGRAAVAKEVKLTFTEDKNYQVDFFGWLSSEIGAEYNGYVATGLFENDIDTYAFREIGILDPVGTKVTVRAEVLVPYRDELGPVLDAVLLSVRSGGSQRIVERKENAPSMSAEEAKALVERLPGFALYRDAAVGRGAAYRLEAEDGGTIWNIRLYVEGDGVTGVTFPIERWRVDKATGAISKVFP